MKNHLCCFPPQLVGGFNLSGFQDKPWSQMAFPVNDVYCFFRAHLQRCLGREVGMINSRENCGQEVGGGRVIQLNEHKRHVFSMSKDS